VIDLSTQEGVEAFMADELERYAETVASDGKANGMSFVPRAIVFATRGTEGEKLPTPMLVPMFALMRFAPSDRDGFSDAIADAIKTFDACGVVFAAESWMATGKDRSALPKDLSQAPDRREVIFVSLEHVALASPKIWVGPIARDMKGRPRVTGWESRDGMQGWGGRFAHLLKRGTS
jgi:hypothetical protein